MYWMTHCLCPLGHSHVAWLLSPVHCWPWSGRTDSCFRLSWCPWVFFLISALPIRCQRQLLTPPSNVVNPKCLHILSFVLLGQKPHRWKASPLPTPGTPPRLRQALGRPAGHKEPSHCGQLACYQALVEKLGSEMSPFLSRPRNPPFPGQGTSRLLI